MFVFGKLVVHVVDHASIINPPPQVSEVGIERVVVSLDAQWAYERVDPITAASEYPMLMKTSDAGCQD